MPTSLSGAIIAAGRGDRLRSATNHLPKPLVEINGEPLLQRQVRSMLDAGICSIHAVVNEETAALLNDRRIRLPDEVRLVVANTASSMESLFVLGEQIRSQQFVLATVDSLIDLGEFKRFLDYGRELTARESLDGVLGVVRWRGDARPLFVSVEDGLITRIGDQEGAMVTAGVYFLSTRIFSYAQEAGRLKLNALRRFLTLLVERGLRFGAYRFELAIDVDEEADLRTARTVFASESQSRRS